MEPADAISWQAPAFSSSIKTSHINIEIVGYVSTVSNRDGRIWCITRDEVVEQTVCQLEAEVVCNLVG